MNFTKHTLLSTVLICVILSISNSLLGSPYRMTTKDILAIWEYSCIKHLEEGNTLRAQQLLKIMNWQCDNKEGMSLRDINAYKEASIKLEEARIARAKNTKNGKKWICYDDRFHSKTKSIFMDNLGIRIHNVLKKAGIKTNVAHVVISQVVIETAWGKRIFGNNLFNIKGAYDNESVNFTTHEQLQNGRWVTIKDSFRKYPTIEDSIGDYLNLLKEKWPDSYNALFSSGKNAVDKFVSGLHAGQPGGYATDKEYEQKILSINQRADSDASIGPFFSSNIFKLSGKTSRT